MGEGLLQYGFRPDAEGFVRGGGFVEEGASVGVGGGGADGGGSAFSDVGDG